MGKAERRVSLTKEEIKALCEEAADKAVERSEKARKKSIAQEKKTLLYNTKKLLENYTKLKDYAEKAVCTIDEAEQVDESIVNMDTLQAGEWSTTQRKRKCSALKRALHSWDSSIG